MKMKMTLLVAFAMMAFASNSFATSVGLNFVGGRSGGGGAGTGGTAGNLVTGTAGVVTQGNWNNALGSNGGPFALVDSDGNATGATATWSGVPNSWTVSGDAAADGNAQLMNGYVDTNTTSTTTLQVMDVPYHLYDVIVYFDGDGTGRSGNYTVNGMTVLGADNANWPVGAGGGVFDDATNDNVGNFIRFSGLSGGLNATAMAANFRGPVNGIQIINIPEPATVALLGMVGIAAIRRRRAA